MTEQVPKQAKPAAIPQQTSRVAASEPEEIVPIEQALLDPAQIIRLQRMIGNRAVSRLIARKQNTTGMPDELKSGVESLSGMAMDDVQVHYNSSKPAQLQAHAYAQGADIHVAPGQEQHLPHEAWHVVQQKQGRVQPTVQLQDTHVNTDTTLEREADTMGAKAAQTKATDGPLKQAQASSETAQMMFEDPNLWIGVFVGGVMITGSIVGYLLGACGGDKKVAAAKLQNKVGDPDDKKKQKKKKSSTTGTKPNVTTKKATIEDDDSDDVDNAPEMDEAEFVKSLMAVSGKAEKAEPKKTEAAATPSAAPTPADEWKFKQSDFGNDCDSVMPQLNPSSRTPSGFGDHGVTQSSVIAKLPAIGKNNIWLQGRPNNSSSEVRVYVECTATGAQVSGGAVVISDGLSHQTKRDSGTYWAYRRTGNKQFIHYGGSKHSKDPTP